mgnify:FL=1|jgi:branched-subunit amino acid ABC-type transport system permease component|tara:strand:- start:278 stop:694 length:417 start_codon:yes stop_codon:yes gene_type:complete
MNTLKNPKVIFIVIGVINLLHGLLFFFGGAEVLTASFPEMEEISDETNFLVVFGMEITAGFNFILGMTLLFCSKLKYPESKNVLLGLGLGLLFIVAIAVKHTIQSQTEIEIAGPIIVGLLAIWSLFAGIKGDDSVVDQ